MKPGGKLILDLTDGVHMRTNYSPRSWEWIDDETFVCRERQLSKDGRRLNSREVITATSKGVIRDQFYQERLYSRDDIRVMLEAAGLVMEEVGNDGVDAAEGKLVTTVTVANDLSKRGEAKRREDYEVKPLGSGHLILDAKNLGNAQFERWSLPDSQSDPSAGATTDPQCPPPCTIVFRLADSADQYWQLPKFGVMEPLNMFEPIQITATLSTTNTPIRLSNISRTFLTELEAHVLSAATENLLRGILKNQRSILNSSYTDR
ncbi:hypothetical protein HK101_001133, partial [Irineochytrium annulatum]